MDDWVAKDLGAQRWTWKEVMNQMGAMERIQLTVDMEVLKVVDLGVGKSHHCCVCEFAKVER